jgi:hypothetical protein
MPLGWRNTATSRETLAQDSTFKTTACIWVQFELSQSCSCTYMHAAALRSLVQQPRHQEMVSRLLTKYSHTPSGLASLLADPP